ncbi:MAG: type II toxin-antitoxin system prevent-host-death family antitoxin [Gammaproteobacteria bacterium]
MLTVNVYEAKTRLSRLLEQAAAGEEIIIAKSGKPIAKLIPYREDERPRKPVIGAARYVSRTSMSFPRLPLFGASRREAAARYPCAALVVGQP